MSIDKGGVEKHYLFSRQDAKNAKKTKGMGSIADDAILSRLEVHG